MFKGKRKQSGKKKIAILVSATTLLSAILPVSRDGLVPMFLQVPKTENRRFILLKGLERG